LAEIASSTLIALLVAFIILSQAIKIVREYERVVIFRLGRFSGVKGPGIFFIIPIIDRVMLLDLRVFTIDVAHHADVDLRFRGRRLLGLGFGF